MLGWDFDGIIASYQIQGKQIGNLASSIFNLLINHIILSVDSPCSFILLKNYCLSSVHDFVFSVGPFYCLFFLVMPSSLHREGRYDRFGDDGPISV